MILASTFAGCLLNVTAGVAFLKPSESCCRLRVQMGQRSVPPVRSGVASSSPPLLLLASSPLALSSSLAQSLARPPRLTHAVTSGREVEFECAYHWSPA
eukprot:3762606-Rhodomonas_salina.2